MVNVGVNWVMVLENEKEEKRHTNKKADINIVIYF
jgi:hypothetical protein